MNTIQALILAAGMSSRFGPELNKLTTPLCGKPLVMHCVTMLKQQNSMPITIIVGHQKELIMNAVDAYALADISYALQETQSGTGHAVMCSRALWHADHMLILNGDMPLVSQTVIQELCTAHLQTDAAVSFVTALPDTLTHAYGRILDDEQGVRIVEAKDFTGDISYLYPINAGIYIFKRTFLEEMIDTLTTNNASHELYLTDLIACASKSGLRVTTINVPFDMVRGINTREEWCIAQEIKRKQIITYWMQQGVMITLPETVHIDDTVTIGRNVHIHAGVHLLGNTTVGNHCTINPYSIIESSNIEDHCTIYDHSHISNSYLETHSAVGPFAHVRNYTHLEPYAQIGNFVEVKQSRIGAHTKAKHLSYLGNTTTGKQVNIGAGTITCNYDGTHKHATIIDDNVFIGSNNTLIAPIHIGESAYTAAGSTITEDVPSCALAIGRTRQVNKMEYAQKLRNKIITTPSSTPLAEK